MPDRQGATSPPPPYTTVLYKLPWLCSISNLQWEKCPMTQTGKCGGLSIFSPSLLISCNPPAKNKRMAIICFIKFQLHQDFNLRTYIYYIVLLSFILPSFLATLLLLLYHKMKRNAKKINKELKGKPLHLKIWINEGFSLLTQTPHLICTVKIHIPDGTDQDLRICAQLYKPIKIYLPTLGVKLNLCSWEGMG